MLEQKRTSGSQIFPAPADGAVIEETPPVFSFLRDGKEKKYRVVVQDRSGKIVFEAETEKNHVVPKEPLKPGKYRWNLLCGEEERGWQEFVISENAAVILRKDAETVFCAVPDVRPRHLFFKEDIPGILKKRKAETEVLKRNIEAACARELPKPPLFYSFEDGLPYREYFGEYREYCDRDMVACALGYALLGDEGAGKKAKELLLTICSWNPDGPCAVNAPWNDEIGLSNARCIPAVYDMLYDILTDQQRYIAEKTIIAYAEQCEERLRALDFAENPGDSHAGRLPAYLGEAALVLKGSTYIKEEILIRWLSYALEIYGGIFPFYGTADGGWAEGPFYASSYTKWYLPFFMAVERFADVRFLDRPFYQRLPQFLLHFAEKERENHPFGDGYWCGSEDPEWKGFFAQNPFRLYAERFGPEEARIKAEQYAAPELFELHLLDVFLPEGRMPERGLTGEACAMAVFEGAGLASCQTNVADQAHDTGLLVRASRFGSVSHQHADQGSFALIRNNKVLITPSGYFGRCWGTKHHRNWTKTTKAHNCILVNGRGQETDSFRAAGRFTDWKHEENKRFFLRLDLREAYPMLEFYERSFELTEKELVIRDEIRSKEACEISWLLHMLDRPALQEDGTLVLEHGGERAVVFPDKAFCGTPDITGRFGTDVNEGVEEAFRVSMEDQYHVTFITQKKKQHYIEVKICIV
ncbi:MAG: heparinase II/III family protein [Eisenbergiella sp.]